MLSIKLLVHFTLDWTKEVYRGKGRESWRDIITQCKGRQSLVGPRVSYTTQVYIHFPSYNGCICPHLYNYYITAFITMSELVFMFNGNVLSRRIV